MFRALLVLLALALLLPPAPLHAQNRAIQQELLLNDEEKKAIQEALAWTGHYEARIDGVFGPATRSAIRAFQQNQGFRPTGYLRQRHLDRLMELRAELTQRFGWQIRRFADLGMEIGVPTALFGEPEATDIGLRFRSKDGQPKSELLLYSAVPMSEKRFELLREEVVDREIFSRNTYDAGDENWFVFSGTSDKGVEQYTHVINRNDGVRGFSFRYLERDHDRLSPLNVAMYNSLRAFRADERPEPATETSPPPPTDAQALFDEEELARLEGRPVPERARQPERRSTGFLVNEKGAILTTASAIEGCEAVRVNDRVDASIKAIDRGHDLALLTIPDQGRELPHLSFRAQALTKGEGVRALVYPRGSREGGIETQQGKIEALRTPSGEIGRLRVSADLRGGSRGAPLIDASGQVVGVVVGRALPRTASAAEEDAQLPNDERLAVHGLIAQAFLEAEGVNYAVGRKVEAEDGVDVRTRLATLQLECSG